MANMQRQECFILANNFVGDDLPGKVYLSRMVVPFSQILTAVIFEDLLQTGKMSPLKYLVFNLHDTNISNFLRFLGYWDAYGYSKHVKYASSVRLEVIKETNRDYEKSPNIGIYYIRIVYDDEEISVPFCKGLYCKFEEFTDHVTSNLMSDLAEAEAYC